MFAVFSGLKGAENNGPPGAVKPPLARHATPSFPFTGLPGTPSPTKKGGYFKKIMSDTLNTPRLPGLGILQPLGDEDRDILSGYGEFRPVQAGQHLIEEGMTQNGVYFVISGKFHASSTRGGHKVLLGAVETGETIGEINVLDPSVASATVTAREFSQVWFIDSKSLETYINEYPGPAAWLLIGIGKTIARRLRAVNEKIASLYS